jgi:hypothetical protein
METQKKMKCDKCGSEVFVQEGFYKTREFVSVIEDETTGNDIIFLDLEPVVSKPVYFDEYYCKECGELYGIE